MAQTQEPTFYKTLLLSCSFASGQVRMPDSSQGPNSHAVAMLTKVMLFAACKRQIKAEQAEKRELQESTAAASLEREIKGCEQKLASTLKIVAVGEAR